MPRVPGMPRSGTQQTSAGPGGAEALPVVPRGSGALYGVGPVASVIPGPSGSGPFGGMRRPADRAPDKWGG